MAISDVLAKLLELLGLKASEQKKLLKMEHALRDKKALNEDRLDTLKDQIGRLERKILKKKAEYEASRGKTKEIVGGEIERLFKELDQSQGQESILARNLEQATLALSKLAEIKAALDSGVDEAIFDELSLELQDIIVELKATDQAARQLQAVQYTRAATESVDIAARLAELETEIAEPQTTARGCQAEAVEGLSQASRDRLKQLDSEE
jgi:hypothetical protein